MCCSLQVQVCVLQSFVQKLQVETRLETFKFAVEDFE